MLAIRKKGRIKMSCMNFPRIVVSMFVGAICAVQNPAGAGWGDLVGSGLLQGATQAIGSAIGNAVSGKDEQQGAVRAIHRRADLRGFVG
jgi:hypothetical protein